MMQNNDNVLMNTLLGIDSNSDDACEKEAYAAPALTIVKFMFESDITWGSFEYSQEGGDDAGNTSGNPGDNSNWWDIPV